ncbi:hypothetical protein MVEN_00715600 [Mycena venus]|uniref:Uncharacterized protein n=1 Tax=Mycena venus TaxID=2733690 RepID=A0A8H6YKE7_9AGAR|nr:hypothetical protein MVEN_00715600 [Mycena venus]
MDNDHHMDDEFTSNPNPENPEFVSASYHDGGIFSGSHNFTVAGGTFTNVTKNYTSAPTVPSDFRIIPLGDIDLQHEICLHRGSAVVGRRHERASVRRVYSARVDGRNTPMTVAMYQGCGAEEEWRQDIAKYILSHPTLVQMCGAAISGGIHATFFHGDLIPFENFLDRHRYSPILTVYIRAYCCAEFTGLQDYFLSAFRILLPDRDFTFWIRPSSGRLCADLIPSDFDLSHSNYGKPTLDLWQRMFPLNVPHMEAMVIDTLTLEQFHAICSWDLVRNLGVGTYTPGTVHLGVISASSGSDSVYFDEIVASSNIMVHLPRWKTVQDWEYTNTPGARGEVTEDGWTRFHSSDISNDGITLHVDLYVEQDPEPWLSQANYIFSRLGITSNFTDYERLRPEDATELGFPSIQFNTVFNADRWDADVYAGLRQFHRAKGFNPESQDVAKHLGYPLYQFPSAMDALSAHVQMDEADSDSPEDDQNPVGTDAGGENINHVHESIVDGSLTAMEESGPPSLSDEIPVSRTFRVLMNVQWLLILFLTLSWLNDQVW